MNNNMRLDKICRTCLKEKTCLKPLFNACVPNMLMSCASIQVIEGDGLPHQICTQCLQMVNRAYSFRQLCEKSDVSLKDYLNNIGLPTNIDIRTNGISQIKTDHLFVNASDELHQSSLFQDIFDDASHALVTNFHTNENVSDLAETMQSLQTIAEQCLPETWDTETNIISCNTDGDENITNSFELPPLYRCQFCEDVFKDEWSFGEHTKIHTGQKYFCSICGRTCATSDLLSKHLLGHTSDKVCEENKTCNISMCNICDTTFENEVYFQKHLKEIHLIVNMDSLNQSSAAKKYTCTVCNKSYKQNKLLQIHMRVHTGERPFRCEICNKTFIFSSSLYKHKNSHCTEKKFGCTLCGKKFNQSSNLTAHMRSHSGEKPFICSLCGKGLVSNANRIIHMRTHTGEKPYKCNQCQSTFATNSQLKKHVLKHTGERPYQCWQCGKNFRQKETRDTHLRYHTGERPYACSFCPKKYIAASHLRVHLKKHTNEKKHHCNICLKKFVEASILKSHILTHTGQKPYTCQYCDNSFTQSASLRTHIKNRHKVD